MDLNVEMRKILDPSKIKKMINKKNNIVRMLQVMKKDTNHPKENKNVTFRNDDQLSTDRSKRNTSQKLHTKSQKNLRKVDEID